MAFNLLPDNPLSAMPFLSMCWPPVAILDSRQRCLIVYLSPFVLCVVRLFAFCFPVKRERAMKKFLVLVFVAAAVGIVLSRDKPSGPVPVEPSLDGRAGVASAQQADTGGEEPVAAPTASRGASEEVAEKSPPRSDKAIAAASAPATEEAVADAEAKAEDTSRTDVPPRPDDLGESAGAKNALYEIEQVRVLLGKGEKVKAARILTAVYRKARGEAREKVREILAWVSRELFFNPRCLDLAVVHVVKRGENLTSIARKYKINWRLIARLNGIEHPKVLREGQELKIVSGEAEVLVRKSDFTLALFLDGILVKEYRVGIGEGDKTPTGRFTVETREVRPPWTPPGGTPIRYGEEGYLIGERWLGFKNQPGALGIAIHGTVDRDSIGKKCSNGCVRLLNEDVIELYDFVGKGTKVEIVG